MDFLIRIIFHLRDFLVYLFPTISFLEFELKLGVGLILPAFSVGVGTFAFGFFLQISPGLAFALLSFTGGLGAKLVNSKTLTV